MFTKKRLIIFMFSLMTLTMILFGCSSGGDSETEASNENGDNGGNGEQITIRFAHEEGSGDVQDLYAQKFKELLEERTDGRITVDIYTAGTLGSNADLFTQLQTGAIEFAILSPGFTGKVIPEAQVMNIPFLFSDNLEVNKKVLEESEALYGPLADQYKQKGITPFKFWLEGFMYWTANKPIQDPADMKGLKMRGMPTDMIMEAYRHLGADPQGTDSGEIYTMLQTGGIDGQENPLFYIYSSRFHEVQDYLMESRHHIYTTLTAANTNWFESLSTEDQELITEIVDEVNDWSFTMQSEENERALDAIKESDIEIVEITSEQREKFKELAMNVKDEYLAKGGEHAQEILETIEKEIEEAEAELKE